MHWKLVEVYLKNGGKGALPPVDLAMQSMLLGRLNVGAGFLVDLYLAISEQLTRPLLMRVGKTNLIVGVGEETACSAVPDRWFYFGFAGYGNSRPNASLASW